MDIEIKDYDMTRTYTYGTKQKRRRVLVWKHEGKWQSGRTKE